MRVLSLLTILASVTFAAAEAPLNSNGNVVPDSYIVLFKNTVSPADVTQHMDNLKNWTLTFPLPSREAGNLGISVNQTEGAVGYSSSHNTTTSNVEQNSTDSNVEQTAGGDDENTSENNNSEENGNQVDYANGIKGITHTWFYEELHYFGYSGKFSKEVLRLIRQDSNVKSVDQDQIVGIAST